MNQQSLTTDCGDNGQCVKMGIWTPKVANFIGTMIFCLFTNGFWSTSFSGKKTYVSAVKCDEMLMWTLQVKLCRSGGISAGRPGNYILDLHFKKPIKDCVDMMRQDEVQVEDEIWWVFGKFWEVVPYLYLKERSHALKAAFRGCHAHGFRQLNSDAHDGCESVLEFSTTATRQTHLTLWLFNIAMEHGPNRNRWFTSFYLLIAWWF